MQTSKSITAMSYLPVDVLSDRLGYLIDHDILDFWGFIFHHGELELMGVLDPSEAERDKDHVHLYMQPAKKINTASFSDLSFGLCMVDPSGNPIPLKTVGYRKCPSFIDWYLYSMHYEPYLRTKLEVKEFHYSPSDFSWSNKSVAAAMIDEALAMTPFVKAMRVRTFLENGGSVDDLAYQGVITPGEAFAYRNFGHMFKWGQWRSGKHIEQIDSDTGRILSDFASDAFHTGKPADITD